MSLCLGISKAAVDSVDRLCNPARLHRRRSSSCCVASIIASYTARGKFIRQFAAFILNQC